MSDFECLPVGTAARLAQAEAERDALKAENERLSWIVNAASWHRAQEEHNALRAERDALLEALEVARRVITNDRESLVECSTCPDGTMDRDAADYVAYYDAALAQIDEATKGGGNG